MDLGPKAEMREIRTSGLMSGIWKRNGLIVTAPDLDSTAKVEATSSLRVSRRRYSCAEGRPWVRVESGVARQVKGVILRFKLWRKRPKPSVAQRSGSWMSV